jgi:hypothetical protein
MAIRTTAHFGSIGVNELKYRRNGKGAATIRRTGPREGRKVRRLRFEGLTRGGDKSRRQRRGETLVPNPVRDRRAPRGRPLSAAARIAARRPSEQSPAGRRASEGDR